MSRILRRTVRLFSSHPNSGNVTQSIKIFDKEKLYHYAIPSYITLIGSCGFVGGVAGAMDGYDSFESILKTTMGVSGGLAFGILAPVIIPPMAMGKIITEMKKSGQAAKRN